MKYVALKHKTYNLPGKGQVDIDATANSIILIPEEGSKIYLHWKTESGKLASTYTMSFATKVEGKVTMINALDKATVVKTVW
jgi:hypothetical protein